MLSNRIALAVVGGACVVAAGTGAYVASRHTSQAAPAPIVESQPPATGSPAADAAGGQPVQETEAALDPQKPASEPGDPTAAASPDPAVTAPSAPAAKPTRAPRPERPTRPAPEQPQPRVEPRVPARAEEPRVARSAPDYTGARDTAGRPTTTMPPARTEPVEPLALPTDQEGRREPARAPGRQLEEVVVAADSVIGLQLDHTLSSETARVEDRVSARVTRDVSVDGRVAIPAGSRVLGAVTVADRGGKMKERARLGVRFHTLVLADGTEVPIQTDTVYREGDSPSSASAAKIGGGAIGGAIIGGILGGAKGAIIGGSTGAAGGTAAVMAGDRKPATMSAGSTMTVRVLSPVSVTVDRVRD